jgi:geranylgeranyl reductase family protein
VTIGVHDVVVLGGGPGGLLAATRLAERGFQVALVEEHRSIGEPVHCTGVLADEAFDEFDIPREALLNPLQTARFYSPSGQNIEYTTSAVEAIVIDRRVFDATLAQQAAGAGVQLISGTRVADIAVGSHGVVLRGSGRELRGRSCILACGANYTFQKRLGLGIPAVTLQSAQMELPARCLGDVELHFGADIAPQGFAWAVPVVRPSGPHVRVGVMCARDASTHFQRILHRVAPRWGVQVDGNGAPRQRLLPLSSIARTYSDRCLVVGDAAGLVKPTTGGGIYYSLLSASIAADVLGGALNRGTPDAMALREYEAQWRRRLAPELRAQLSLRMAAQRLTDADIGDLFDLAKTDGIMPIVRRTAQFNRHRSLILALFRHPPARRVLLRRLAG